MTGTTASPFGPWSRGNSMATLNAQLPIEVQMRCLTDLVLGLSGSPGPIPELFHSTKTSGTKVGRPLWLWCGWHFRGFGLGRPPAVLNALAGP